MNRPLDRAEASHKDLLTSSSFLERFLDNFLNERSIRWLAVLGAAIVAASSLMFVSQEWSDLSVVIRVLVIVGYTAGTYGVAELCGNKLGLLSTAHVLRALTLVLIPISFMATSWLTRGEITATSVATTLAVLIPAMALAAKACDRIFKHWLRGRQLTFTGAYLLLSVAGAMPPLSEPWLMTLFISGFWVVMTLGLLKVNRHLFWMIEENRWPRVFGFTPLALLMGLLGMLIISKCIPAMPIHWLGLFMVGLAFTLLHTTRSVADVFRQRTGDLVRPLPWTILTPLGIALVAMIVGLGLSHIGFSFRGPSTFAAVPTTACAAILLAYVARDTRQSAFVWASLILAVVAYQETPILLGGWLDEIKSAAANAVDEHRLPVAFYGLTYLPLLISASMASLLAKRQGRDDFSKPLQKFTTALSLGLTALSLTNLKAACVVSIIGVALWTFYVLVFRDRRYIMGSCTCAIIACVVLIPAGNAWDWWDLPLQWSMVSTGLITMVISLASPMDRWLSSLSTREQIGAPENWGRAPVRYMTVQDFGRCAQTLLGVVWLITSGVELILRLDGPTSDGTTLPSWISLGILSFGLFWPVVQSRRYVWGTAFWSFLALAYTLQLQASFSDLSFSAFWISVISGALAFVCHRWVRNHRNVDENAETVACLNRSIGFGTAPNVMTAFAMPLGVVAMTIHLLLQGAYWFPQVFLANLTLDPSAMTSGWPIVYGLGVLLSYYLPYREPRTVVAATMPLGMAALYGGILEQPLSISMLPIIYVVSITLGFFVSWRWSAERTGCHKSILRFWAMPLIAIGCFYLHANIWGSAVVALAVAYLADRRSSRSSWRVAYHLAAIWLSLLFVPIVMGFVGALPTAASFLQREQLPPFMFALCACWYAMHGWRGSSWFATSHVTAVGFLNVLSIGFAAWSLLTPHASLLRAIMLVGGMSLFAATFFKQAVNQQREDRVWAALFTAATACVWFGWYLNTDVSLIGLQLLMVVLAPIAAALAHRASTAGRLQIVTRPLERASVSLPAIATLISVASINGSPWHTLAMFAASMNYFVMGLNRKSRAFVVAAAITLNLALALLFHRLSFTDPQFYLIPLGLSAIGYVEMMKDSLPAKSHNPIRYAGAWAILVSPCFAILQGSWLHIGSLMLLSILIVLLAIGLRLRSLMHAGTAFLLIDLVAMLVRSSIDHPQSLWLFGVLVGAGVLSIAAVCERNRERLLARLRMLNAQWATWS